MSVEHRLRALFCLEAMEADVAAGLMEELDHHRRFKVTKSPSSPTRPWKTLRVYHSHFENAFAFPTAPTASGLLRYRSTKTLIVSPSVLDTYRCYSGGRF